MIHANLSDDTIAFLHGLCYASHVAYTEAGMVFRLVRDKEIDSNDIPWELREQPFLVTDHRVPLPGTPQLRDFARFIIGAIGGNADRIPSHSDVEAANELIVRLHADLNFDWFNIELEECDFGMDLMLHMGCDRSDSLATLLLSWRID